MEHDLPILRYTHKAYAVRGTVIDLTILLERIMDEFIASYFSDNLIRKIEMMEMIVCGLPYRAKVDLFIKVLSKIKLDKRKYNYENIKKEFLYISKKRNRFAHDLLNINLPEDKMEKYEISLSDYTDVTKSVHYDRPQINDLLLRIRAHTALLMEIRDLPHSGNHPA